MVSTMDRIEEDLYSGYNAGDALEGALAGQAFGDTSETSTSYSRSSTRTPVTVPGTAMGMGPGRMGTPAMRMGTSIIPGTAMRMGTASVDPEARPMTSNKGAGYSSAPKGRFDPLNQASRSPAQPLAKKTELSPEEQCKAAERKVHVLLEESAEAYVKGDNTAALERAKEAGKRDQQVRKLREQVGLMEQINAELTFAVVLNMAHMYHANQLYTEALNAYTMLVKNKAYPQAGRFRVNMGNIYFEQRKFPAAIKMYRMAVDQVATTSRSARLKIMRNIGIAFVRMGQYQDALQTFESIMEAQPDHHAGFNLAVSTFALGDKEKMKQAFLQLLQVPPFESEEDEHPLPVDDEAAEHDVVNDDLKRELRSRQNDIHRCILNAARLLAPVLHRDGFVAGYDWCAEALTAGGYETLANEVALAKAGAFLEGQNFDEAVAVLKEFEKKEHRLKTRAATNLSFLYFLEEDLANAERYADLAVKTDRYSAQALVNKGNAAAGRGDLDTAKSLYTEAIAAEADCVEAIYNLGIVQRRLGVHDDALRCFKKLSIMMPSNVEVMYQIGNVYELLGDFKQAVEWLERLHTKVPHDPGVLARLGQLHVKLDEEGEALRYYSEAHRVFPVNIDVISWLGAFHVKNEVYEKAMPYFALAAQLQPTQVKWQLMVASCLRRIGAYPQALQKYKDIHASHPNNIECLRYLVHICTDLGLPAEVQEYAVKMRKAERQQPSQPQASVSTQQQQQQPGGSTFVARPASGAPSFSGNGRDSHTPADDEPAFQMPASTAKKAVVRHNKDRDDDEWGNEELGDDLLPLASELDASRPLLTERELDRQRMRTVFDFEQWSEHRSPERYMRHLIDLPKSRIAKGVMQPVAWVLFLSTGVAVLESYIDAHPQFLPWAASSAASTDAFNLTAFALSLLLAFRLDASYNRWLQARAAWGGLVYNCRDLMRQALVDMPGGPESAALRMLARWVTAFPKVLMCHVREDGDLQEELQGLLPVEELGLLLGRPDMHCPTVTIAVITDIIAAANLDQDQRMLLDAKLSYFHETVGICERIIKTPIPRSYTRHTSRFLVLWLAYMPFTLWKSYHWSMIAVGGSIAFLLLAIEEIGVQIEEPFGILPLENLVDTIEMNIQEMLHIQPAVSAMVASRLAQQAQRGQQRTAGAAQRAANGVDQAAVSD
ncbi:hypothetical protein WJX72_011075 [[Myrmecia] bisecta]|uniref:Uncharacterized protein n=1 Tax=[Myrmecia] bisecta TaxID=41462 RepID=A0AAW1P6D9_9CHLO